MSSLSRPFRRAIAAATTVTGKRFGLLVASSLVATSAIVASAITNPADDGPLAALLGRSLAADNAPAVTSPAAGPSQSPAAGSAGSSAQPAGDPATQAGGPPASVPISTPAAGRPESPPATPSTPTAPSDPSPEAGRIKHVFVISLASPGYEAAFGSSSQMPYLATTLRPQGQLLSGYSLIGKAGLANDIAAVSGQPPNPSTEANCSTYSEFPAGSKANSKGIVSGSGCLYPVETLTLADQLTSGGLQWRGYIEGMAGETGQPQNCVQPGVGAVDQPAPGGYAARKNPFVYFHSLLDLGDCATSDLPITQLNTDLSKISSTPNYSFIAPSLCNAGLAGQCPAGSPEGPAAANAFLSQWVPKILASPAYKQDGLLIVTFDESNPTASATGTTSTPTTAADAQQVGALLLSRYVTRGATDATAYNPYSLLRSTEDLFGLAHLAAANGAKVKSFAPALLGETGGD